MKRFFRGLFALTLIALGALFFGRMDARAADPVVVGVDQIRLIRLDRDVDAVLLAQPGMAWIDFQTRRLMVVQGRQAGESGLILLDRDRNEIMNTVVVVTDTAQQQISVHRGGSALTEEKFACGERCAKLPTNAAAAGRTGSGGAGGSRGASGGQPPEAESYPRDTDNAGN